MAHVDTVVVHHSGGLGTLNYASTAHLTFDHINNAHKARWSDFESELGYHVGYTFVIFPDGHFVQTRKVGEAGAHTIRMNTRSVGICFVGNGNDLGDGKPVDEVTPKAINAYKNIISMLKEKRGVTIKKGTTLDISDDRIFPHRAFSQTHCYGTAYKDSWCRDILKDEKPKLSLNVIIMVYLLFKKLHGEYRALQELKKLLKVIGSTEKDRECDGNI